MTRRSPEQYDWSALAFDDTRLTKHFTSPRRERIQFTVAHHMTVRGTGSGSALDACWSIWQAREASAHYGVDGRLVRQYVGDGDAAWATGTSHGNHAGISIEHANSATGDASGWPIAEDTLSTGARLTAAIHHAYGLGRPTSNGNGSAGTMRAHRSFTSTACPGPWFMSNWGRYVAMAQAAYDNPTGGDDMPSAREIAAEVWLLGHGELGGNARDFLASLPVRIWMVRHAALGGRTAFEALATTEAKVDAVIDAVGKLDGVDPDAIRDAVREAVESISVTVRPASSEQVTEP